MTSLPVHSRPDDGMSGEADWPPGTVEVTTGARLHFGLLTHRPVSGREFGGLGVMIDSPGWTIRVASNTVPGDDEIDLSSDVFRACPDLAVKCRSVLDRWRRSARSPAVETYRIGIRSAIPSHRGLGSGTQLALAVACAVDRLESESAGRVAAAGVAELDELARRSGRGLRSAVGSWGFEQGGLIVDGGKSSSETIGTLIARLPFPPDWRFVLIAPASGAGIAGNDEVAAFRELPGMTSESTARLSAIALMRFLPAVRDGCFDECSDALTCYGRIVGEYFAPVQGGVFADPDMSDVAVEVRRAGVTGFAQTSWGPTCAALCRSSGEADEIVVRLKKQFGKAFEIRVAAPLNAGASVRIL